MFHVEAEIAEVLGDDHNYGSEKPKRPQSIDWAIEEIERMHPAAHMCMRGVRDNYEIDGYEVSEGTMAQRESSFSA